MALGAILYYVGDIDFFLDLKLPLDRTALMLDTGF